MHDHDFIIAGLKALDADLAVHGPDALAGRDPGQHKSNFAAGILVEPADATSASAVIRFAAAHGIGIVPQGGRTGLVGGGESHPGEIVLGTGRLARIEALNAAERTVVVGAGVALQVLQEEAARHGLATGIDLAARGSATIGGMVSTNAGGILAFRNGVMRHQVLGLEVVLPDGSILSDLTRVVKVSAGPDLKQLFIGGEGAFGFVTRVVMKLETLRTERASALIGLPSAAAALKLAAALQSQPGAQLEGAEIMWRQHFADSCRAHGFDGSFLPEGTPAVLLTAVSAETSDAAAQVLETVLADHWEPLRLANALVSRSIAQDRSFWKLREESDFIYTFHPDAPSYDVSMPPGQLDAYHAQLLARLIAIHPDFGAYVYGHMADGNLHISISGRLAPEARFKQAIEDAVYDGVQASGGSFSAEHGVGTDKQAAYLKHVSPEKQALARALKRLIDPQGLFNHGKVPF